MESVGVDSGIQTRSLEITTEMERPILPSTIPPEVPGGSSPLPVFQPMESAGVDLDSNPFPGDYDGDGRTDIAIYDTTGGAWWIIPSSGTPAYGVGWGGSGFSPVLGDYDGDGKTDIAIYNTTTGAWWIIPSSGVGPQGQVGAYGVGWGGSGFTPVPGDYDGDGKTDVAVYQNSNGGWWIIHSSDGSTYGMGWGGEASDVPLTTNPD